MKYIKNITTTRLVVFTSVFLTLFYNTKFFKNTTAIYPVSSVNIPFLISVAVIFTSLIVFSITLISSKYTTKPVLVFILMVSSLAAYFMNAYNIIIDENPPKICLMF